MKGFLQLAVQKLVKVAERLLLAVANLGLGPPILAYSYVIYSVLDANVIYGKKR